MVLLRVLVAARLAARCPWRQPEPVRPGEEHLPLEAVRDLLGVVRALYRAWRDQGRPANELAHLETIGKDLRAALDLARRAPPPSLGHAAAWARAERATKALGQIVGDAECLAPAVRAVVAKLR